MLKNIIATEGAFTMHIPKLLNRKEHFYKTCFFDEGKRDHIYCDGRRPDSEC